MTAPTRPVRLTDLTAARVALGRSGASLPTTAALAFALDHARARDAVHRPADVDGLEGALRNRRLATLRVESAATDRLTYLARPDLGRQLAEPSRSLLARARPRATVDLAVVIADGLSSRALDHAPALLDVLLPDLATDGWSLAPVVIAQQARVALGDEVGLLLDARLTLLLVGERPGLSSPDSLGAYITYAPRPGRTDAERNCVSNIRPAGLPPADAAAKIAWLLRQALKGRMTGVGLKDESPTGPSLVDGGDVARLAPRE